MTTATAPPTSPTTRHGNEDRSKDGIEGDCLLLESTRRSAHDHEQGHGKDKEELFSLGLGSESPETGLECATSPHNANEATQYKDENDDVDGLDRSRHHAVRNLSDTGWMGCQALIGAWY